MRSRLTLTTLAVTAASLLSTMAGAQPYDVSWYTVDGGGGTSSGGSYVLSGTAGQPDAGGPFAGGTYGLHSGFWSIAAGGAIGPQADLSVTKTDGQATAVPGQGATYTIVAGNAGPNAVTGATVTDTPPAALTNVNWTCSASPGSSCPASGAGSIAASVNLLVGGTATFTMTATIAPDATGTLVNTASIGAPGGVLDPLAINNAATDTNTLVPSADLGLSVTDTPDPIGQGGLLTYTIQASNTGPSTAAGTTTTHTLPIQVAFVSSSPAFPTCVHLAGVVTCTLGPLAPGANATVTIQGTVSPTALGTISSTAAVTGPTPDPASANNTEIETTTVTVRADGELRHGTRERYDLAALPGPVADEDRYRIRQQPFASYEVVVDETSGDIGLGNGPSLDLMGPDGTTVLRTSDPAGTGPARSLRFENATSSIVDDQTVRVRSASCSTDCGPDDAYRIRAYETTYMVPRFNNSGSQLTVLLLQNPGPVTVNGLIHFWSPAGAALGSRTFTLGPKELLVLPTSSVPGVAGASGTITVVHDGPYGSLTGKTVALEPSTGFSFDSPMEAKRP
jgi:uncharacterized repeat protein (TIGR01451 family)